MERLNFTVEARHPVDGVSVYQIQATQDGDGWYCTNRVLGCSRTYRVAGPQAAIRAFLSEHAETAVSIKQMGE